MVLSFRISEYILQVLGSFIVHHIFGWFHSRFLKSSILLLLAKANLEVSRLKVAAAASRFPLNVANPPTWDPVGYCWLYGFKVKVRNTSATCTTKKPGHKVDTTRADTKDGKKVQQRMDAVTRIGAGG